MIDLEASLEARHRQHAEGCVKIEEDLDRYRKIIADTRPERIIETGTFSGKSALWFARTAGCQVVTIDTNPCLDPDTSDAWNERGAQIAQVLQSSIDPVTLLMLYRVTTDGRRTMVVLDSDHSAAHVLGELAAYAPLVTPGCYMVIEDTLLASMPDEERYYYKGDPSEALGLWLPRQDSEWELDRKIEGMSAVTQHPGGWLKRSR